jgi:hypothetical protein
MVSIMKRKRKSITGTLRREGYTKNEADAIARRIRRRKAKDNPSTGTMVAIGGGIAILSVAAYFLFKSNAPTPTTPPVAAASPAPQLPPNLGDPNDPNSTAYACAAAWRLNRLGHPHEAAVWIARCTAGGGTVPA